MPAGQALLYSFADLCKQMYGKAAVLL